MKGVLLVNSVITDEVEVKRNITLDPDANLELIAMLGDTGANSVITYTNFTNSININDPKPPVIFNRITNEDTGGTWEMKTFRTTSRTTPNERGQTWEGNTYVNALPTYETYVTSGNISGHQLTCVRGEGLGNVEIFDMPLDQKIEISDPNTKKLYTFEKTGGGNLSNASIETYTMNFGVSFASANVDTSLKNQNGSFEFVSDTFLNLEEFLPTDYEADKTIVVKPEDSSGMIHGIELQSNVQQSTFSIGSTLSNQTSNSIILGYNSYNSNVKNKNNIVIGNNSMNSVVGTQHISIGNNTLDLVSSQELDNNICVGYESMKDSTNSNDNICIGIQTGKNCNASGGIWIGHESGMNSTNNDELVIGNTNTHPLLTGILQNDTQLDIHADTVTLSIDIPSENNQMDKSSGQLWNDANAGNILKIGNVASGSLYDIYSGEILQEGNISITTKENNTIVLDGNVYIGNIKTASLSNTTIHLQRQSLPDVNIKNIFDHNCQIIGCTLNEQTGNIQLITKSPNKSNVTMTHNTFKGVTEQVSLNDNILTLSNKEVSNVYISNVLNTNDLISSGIIDSEGNIVLYKQDGSKVQIQENAFNGDISSMSFDTNTNMVSLGRKNMSNVNIGNVLHEDDLITNGFINENGSIVLSKHTNKSNIVCTGDVTDGYILDGTLIENTIVLTRKNTVPVQIANISHIGNVITSGAVSESGELTLTKYDNTTVGIGNVYTATVSGGSSTSTSLILYRMNKPNLDIPLTGTKYSIPQFLPLPPIYMNEIKQPGSTYNTYRYSTITVTAGSNFSSSNPNVVLNGDLSVSSGKGTFNDFVRFEFSTTTEISNDQFAINEIHFILANTDNLTEADLYNGIVLFKGSKDGTQWRTLNTPSCFIFDVDNVTTCGMYNVYRFVLTKNIDNYKFYEINFWDFTNSPDILEINFAYEKSREISFWSGNMSINSNVAWEHPTDVVASYLTSYPAPYKMIVDEHCQVRLSFTNGDYFHASTSNDLIESLEYSVDNGSSYTQITLSSVTSIHTFYKTIDFNFVPSSNTNHDFRIRLFSGDGTPTSYYYFSVTAAECYVFPILDQTTISDTFAPVNKTVVFTSTFSSTFPSGMTVNSSITPQGHDVIVPSTVSFSGNQYEYSCTVLYDVVHVGIITLTLGNANRSYQWANGTYDHNNIFIYPIIQSQSTVTLPTLGFGPGNVIKTYTFDSDMNDFHIDGTFTSNDGNHTGSVTSTSSGNQGVISFPANNPSGYSVSNLKLRNINDADNEYLDISDALYGFNVSVWIPPTTFTVATTTVSNLPSMYLLVVNQSCTIRCTFTGGNDFHSIVPTDLIYSLEYSKNNGNSYSPVPIQNMVIHTNNKTIDFSFVANGADEHLFRFKLKGADGATTDFYTFIVTSNQVFSFPSLVTTTKLAPHDTTQISVGNTLTMVSVFDNTINNSITTGIVVSVTMGSSPSIISQSIDNDTYTYSFIVGSDSDHSGTITFTFGDVIQTYSWSSQYLLSASSHIYSFPNAVTYDGTGNGYDAGMHLRAAFAGTLILSLTGGDMLHSNMLNLQISNITYKTGSSGTLVNVPTSDISINLASGQITISNITPTEVNDVYIVITLLGVDGFTMSSPITAIVVSEQVQSLVIPVSWEWPSGNNNEPNWSTLSDSPWQHTGKLAGNSYIYNQDTFDAFHEAYDFDMFLVHDWFMNNPRAVPSDWSYTQSNPAIAMWGASGGNTRKNPNGELFAYGVRTHAPRLSSWWHNYNAHNTMWMHGESISPAPNPPFVCQGYKYSKYVSRFWMKWPTNLPGSSQTVTVYGYTSRATMALDNKDGYNRVTTFGTLLLSNKNCRATSGVWQTLQNAGSYSHFRIEFHNVSWSYFYNGSGPVFGA